MLDELSVKIAEKVPASRKLGEDTARELIGAAKTIHIAKGKKLETFDGGKATAEVVGKMLGATGNLRAPTIVVGKTLLVGFNDEVYREVFA